MAMMSFLEQLFGLNGETAAVVGGAGRIGRVLCQALASAGADVAIVDLDAAAGEQLGRELRASTDRRVLSVPIDGTREDRLREAVATITGKLGPPAMLVNA